MKPEYGTLIPALISTEPHECGITKPTLQMKKHKLREIKEQSKMQFQIASNKQNI